MQKALICPRNSLFCGHRKGEVSVYVQNHGKAVAKRWIIGHRNNKSVAYVQKINNLKKVMFNYIFN